MTTEPIFRVWDHTARSLRRGSLLIIVAGLSALLASLTLVFLVVMRTDAEESFRSVREAQARLVLSAACMYVLEASRLGWDDPATPIHEEGFGWIDVRDGSIGPRTQVKGADGRYQAVFPVSAARDDGSDVYSLDLDHNGRPDTPVWPAVRSTVRCPLAPMVQPPCAVQALAAPNEMNTDPDDPRFGVPLLTHPDPQPAQATFAAYLRGDPTPRLETLDLAWFRVHREAPAVFVITCGAGASRGFRTWREVQWERAEDQFGDNRATFEAIVANEVRMWFRIAWSGATEPPQLPVQGLTANASRMGAIGANPVGTISWIQRLREPPTLW